MPATPEPERQVRRWWLIAALVTVLVAGGAAIVALRRSADAGVGTWLLPAAILTEPADSYFVGEVEPALWPSPQTISLWRSGDEWLVVHSYPLPEDNLAGTISPLGFLFGEASLPPTPEVPFPAPAPELPEDDVRRDVWTFASPSLDPRLAGALLAGFARDPQPDAVDAPPSIYATEDGDYDPELRAAAEAFRLAARATLEGPPGVQLIFGISGESGLGFASLREPIPLEVLPVAVTEVIAGDGYEVHDTADDALIVRDGLVHAVVRAGSPDARRRAALGVEEVEDERWGAWAWPRLAARLRLADLDDVAAPPDAGCSAVITLDGGCYRDVTPSSGFEWAGSGPTLAGGGDEWTVTLPLERLGLADGVGDGTRLGVVRQSQVLFEFELGRLPMEVTATTTTRREAHRLLAMLYPDEPLPDGD